MKTMLKIVLALIASIPFFSKVIDVQTFAQSSPLTGTSRQVTEAEMESFSNLWQTDPPILTPILEQSFEVDLQGYGDVYFLSFIDSSFSEVSPFLNHWIVDGGRVRRELSTPETMRAANWTFVSLDVVVFGELNFDGFTDIYTIASYTISSYATQASPSGAVSFPVVTLYVQNPEDQSFQVLEAESIELTDRGVSIVAEVEEILREEMLFLP